jgi:predicted 3-demethylubiquinone-9 3-methyltransferase (glyoxalase superfamily)
MQKITPFLWFDRQAEEAVGFYTSIFPNSKVGEMSRYGDNMPMPKGTVLAASFELNGMEFSALNGGPIYQFTPAISFFVNCPSEQALDALWAKLSAGGTVLMELGPYPFSPKFGWLVDRFGISWQLTFSGQPLSIAPYFLFVGEQHGNAEAAIKLYTSLFPNSAIQQIEHFGAGEGEPEGTVKHARFTLAGQEFIAMDSALGHEFTFTPATSFYVHCKDQAEVDYYWEKLTEGGMEVQCGWLSDRFGVSWQIVPDILPELMSDPDPVKAGRVTQAMMQMVKLDIAGLQRAYDQG